MFSPEATPPAEAVDPRYHGLYRVGGIAFVLNGLTYLICVTLTLAIPPSTGDTAAYLHAVAGKQTLFASLWSVYLLGDLLLIPAVLALYVVLKEQSRTLVPVGIGLVAAYIVFDMGITEPNWLALVNLAHGYSSATTGVQRAADVAAGQYALALVPFVNFLSFAVSAAGFLLICMVMLRGLFNRRTAYVGIVTMVVALVAGLSWFVPALGVSILATLLLFGVWGVLVGRQLYSIGVQATIVPPAVVATARMWERQVPSSTAAR